MALSLLSGVAHMWAGVKINELFYDPIDSDAGKEWIEFYNGSEFSVDLSHWQVYAAGASFSLVYTFAHQILEPKTFLLLGAPDFCDIQTDISFQNGGSATDGVKLVDSSGVCQDVLLYDLNNTNDLKIEDGSVGLSFAPDVASGNSLARKVDGEDSDDSYADFRECAKPTPGQTNTEKVVPLKISELFYNPVGADADKEWIEIYNPTDESVDLQGWQIYSAGNDFSLSYSFPSSPTVIPE